MKLENFDYNKLQRLHSRYEACSKALIKVNAVLEIKDDFHTSDGGFTPEGKRTLYTLFISEYSDSRSKGELDFDLTGLELHFELYEALKVMLERKLDALKKEIESL